MNTVSNGRCVTDLAAQVSFMVLVSAAANAGVFLAILGEALGLVARDHVVPSFHVRDTLPVFSDEHTTLIPNLCTY